MFCHFSLFQALAGFRLSDHLCDRAARHAKAAGSSLVVSAQLPSRHCLLLRWPGPRPAQAQGELPQDFDRGQRGGAGEGTVSVLCEKIEATNADFVFKILYFRRNQHSPFLVFIPLFSGTHEDFCWLWINQRHLSLHLHWPPFFSNIHCW